MFRLSPLQAVGMLALLALPALAFGGLFGLSEGTASAANENLRIDVTYPARFRYKQIHDLEVTVQNVGSSPLRAVEARFQQSYISKFSQVTFTPSAATISDAAYIVPLESLQPGETRLVSVSVQAENFWRHEGVISVAAEGGPGVQVSVVTWSFP